MVVCNLCDHRSFEIIEDDQKPFAVLKCKNCSLIFVHPRPSQNELESHYNKRYYDEWISKQQRNRLKMWQKRLKKIIKYKTEGYLLDVGCGEGTFLTLAQKNRWQVSGTEISAFAAKYAADALNTEIYCGDLLSAGLKGQSFDVVTMWHVLEHVINPKKYLSEVHRVLKPGGLLVLAVPNVNNMIFQIVYRILKRRRLKLFSIGDKEIHLYHFSPHTLTAYLKEAEFSCLKLTPDYGIIDPAKKIVNCISVIPYYLGGVQIYDAIEAVAIPKK